MEAKKKKNTAQVVRGKFRGEFFIEGNRTGVRLNPTECTLYQLFLAHPEGIGSESLLFYWKELVAIYGYESVYDERLLQEQTMASLCAESRQVFYSNISRIKRKFIDAVGARKAASYYIKRCSDGLYRTRAVLAE